MNTIHVVNYSTLQETISQYLKSSHASAIISEFQQKFLDNFLMKVSIKLIIQRNRNQMIGMHQIIVKL